MARAISKNLGEPDDRFEMPGLSEAVVELGDVTVGRVTHQPGWRWSTHVKPRVGGDWCETRHVGIVLSGRFGVTMRDQTTMEFGPDDVYEVPAGHDGYTIGHEPCTVLEWAGLRSFAGFRVGARTRALATLLFTDVVDSTAKAKEMGDAAWRELLSLHFEAARGELERYGGREVKTTGDGMLATFDAPANALHCAGAICRSSGSHGLHLRAGVHVGEVEVVGDDVRGIAVHEAARIMSAAGPDEIMVSDTTRVLAQAAGLTFDDRGSHTLKGLSGEWHLYAYRSDAQVAPA